MICICANADVMVAIAFAGSGGDCSMHLGVGGGVIQRGCRATVSIQNSGLQF